MGDSRGKTEFYFPKLLIYTLSLIGFITDTLILVFRFVGISDFLDPQPRVPANQPPKTPEPPVSAILIREILQVIKFSDLTRDADSGEGKPLPESCVMCLEEFEGGDDIRCLINCNHIFHRNCLDLWMDHDKSTCPLCMKHFVPPHLREEFNERLWEASFTYPDFYCEDNVLDTTRIPSRDIHDN